MGFITAFRPRTTGGKIAAVFLVLVSLMIVVATIVTVISILVTIAVSLLALIIVIAALYSFACRTDYLTRATDRLPGTRSEPSQDDALTTIQNRYARGDIDHTAFERQLDDLFETGPPNHVSTHLNDEPETERSR